MMGAENVPRTRATDLLEGSADAAAARPKERTRLTSTRDAVGVVVGGLLGLLPHVLHHVGLIAGAALVTGASGNALFFALGLLLSVPMLRRLYRRFRTWRAPAIAVGVFAALFSLSTFVIGPALAGVSTSENGPPAQTPTQNHQNHHPENG